MHKAWIKLENWANRIVTWVGLFSIMSAILTWVASKAPLLQAYSWPEFVFVGIFGSAFLLLLIMEAMAAYRYFRPLSADSVTARKGVADVTWTAMPANSIESLTRDFEETISALEVRMVERIDSGDHEVAQTMLEQFKNAQDVMAGSQAVDAQIATSVEELRKTVVTERAAIREDLRNAEDARLGQISQIRNDVRPYADRLKATELDLAHLLMFAVNYTAVKRYEWMIAQSPLSHTKAITEYENDVQREAARKNMEGYIRAVMNEVADTLLASDARACLSVGESEAEQLIRKTPQNERPAGIEPLDLRTFLIAHRQCERLVEFLDYQCREVTGHMRHQHNALVERYRERNKS